MSEIERAIKMLERQKEHTGKTRKPDDNAMTSGIITKIENWYETALTVLRAELDRERNAGFEQRDNMEWVDYVTVESVVEKKAPTVKDVLLEKWKNDTRSIAQIMVDSVYDSEDDVYLLDDGFMTNRRAEAIDHEVVRLNSPAEVEK